MPVKKLKDVFIKFIHRGIEYELRHYIIYQMHHGVPNYVCRCDISHLPEYGDEHIMEICAHVALDVYLEQQEKMQERIVEKMQPFAGLYKSLKNIFEGGNKR